MTEGTAKHTLRGHTATVNCIAYDKPSQTFATGSDDMYEIQSRHVCNDFRSIKLWDIRARHCVNTFTRQPSTRVSCIDYDGGIAVGGMEDGGLRLWDIRIMYEHLPMLQLLM